jgi:nucleoside-diphosphate-sugar epimerase
MERVIITGANGFVGRYLVREMVRQGIGVTAIVRNGSGLADGLDAYVAVIETDDYERIDLKQSGYDAFYHLAWGGVDAKKKNDLNIQLDNISLAVSAMRLAKRCGCKKFIGVGSIAEYRLYAQPIDGYEKKTPLDFYGAAKAASYYMLDVLAGQIEIPFIWAVLSSTFGEGCEDNNIIMYTIKELLAGRRPRFGPLTQMWDFLYISDSARALRLLGENDVRGRVYGIGSGSYAPLREYVTKVRDMIAPELELGIGEIPDNRNVLGSCMETHYLKEDTGFCPEVSFEDGIRKTIEFYRTVENRL